MDMICKSVSGSKSWIEARLGGRSVLYIDTGTWVQKRLVVKDQKILLLLTTLFNSRLILTVAGLGDVEFLGRLLLVCLYQ